VELARARYQLPRLRRLWTHLERQRGGTFTRGGAGETQLETDRRVLQRSVRHLEQELEIVRARRADQRRQRHRSWPTLTLVGYTNAGKSTLLNRLTGAQVTARNQLFATLDPTTRRWDIGPDQAVLLTDTVGFIHKLPATLVAAFRATLEEATEADLLLHVVDVSSPHAAGQATVALDELDAIGARAPILTILNKCDALSGPEGERRMEELARTFPDGVFVSGSTGSGLQTLATRVSSTLREQRLTPEG
jgi:GTP-binding protein HflX